VLRFASMMVGAGVTVAITRTEHTAADLGRSAGRSNDAAVTRRLLVRALRWLCHQMLRRRIARAMVLDGFDPTVMLVANSVSSYAAA